MLFLYLSDHLCLRVRVRVRDLGGIDALMDIYIQRKKLLVGIFVGFIQGTLTGDSVPRYPPTGDSVPRYPPTGELRPPLTPYRGTLSPVNPLQGNSVPREPPGLRH